MLLLYFIKRLGFAALKGQLGGSWIQLLDALITTVRLHFVHAMELYATFFKYPIVMFSAFIYSSADNLFAMAAYY